MLFLKNNSKVLAVMSINFLESLDQTPGYPEILTDEIIRKIDDENNYLVYIYEKFSDKLLELLKAKENHNYRKDVTYALLNITCYANRKVKMITDRLTQNSDTSLNKKMTTVNKFSMIFLKDEIDYEYKRDPFMIEFFYKLILV